MSLGSSGMGGKGETRQQGMVSVVGVSGLR